MPNSLLSPADALADTLAEAPTLKANPPKLRLGELLLRDGAVTEAQVRAALATQRASGHPLGRVLKESGVITELTLAKALARQLQLKFLDLNSDMVDVDVAKRIPEVRARRLRALPLHELNGHLVVALTDPTSMNLTDDLERLLGGAFESVVVEESKLLAVIDKVYRSTQQINGLAQELERELAVSADVIDLAQFSSSAGSEDAPVARLLQSLLEDAVRMRASDVHIEPMANRLTMRCRVDGQLRPQTEADVRIGPALALRLKIVAGLDISERRLPQDGRFAVQVGGKAVDIRLSTLPTQYGEAVVMRLLAQGTALLSLDRVGMPPDMVKQLRTTLKRTSGMVLATGPTGSGKTTTLYSILSELNVPERKLITVEDPVEYRLPGVNQVQVNEKIGLSFAAVLRSMLRQDPDVVLVGEMRDHDTAETGLRAAMTGHMVLSSLHTNDAATAPARLVNMGAPAYMVGLALQNVVAQRLLRLVCVNCAVETAPQAAEGAYLQSVLGPNASGGHFLHGRGCHDCNDTGYNGRVGVYELLTLDATLIRELGRHDPSAFADAARAQMGPHTMQRAALNLALQGRTSLTEAMKLAVDAMVSLPTPTPTPTLKPASIPV